MNGEEANLTASEQHAFDRVLETFGADNVIVGKFEPWGPDNPRPKPKVLQEADEVLTEAEERSTWRALDLRGYLQPEDEGDAPSVLLRSDLRALFYAGKRNDLHGPYENGKSWVAKIAGLEVIRAGGLVVWLDFEDSPRSIVGRFLALGASEQELLAGLRYLQPGEPLTAATEIDLRLELLGCSLVVIDAVNEAMASAGLDPNKNADVALWYRTLPRLATEAGATVLVLDHVAKDPANQRGAVGGGHKLAAIDGASYRIDAVESFGRGSSGLLRLRLAKDRPGYVRGLLGPGREPVAADISLNATDPTALLVEVRPPGEAGPWQPTHLMEQVSRFVEEAEGSVSVREIRAAVPGKSAYVAQAIELLVAGDFLSRITGPRGAHLHTSKRPYREGDT